MLSAPLVTPDDPALSPRCGTSSARCSHYSPRSSWSPASSTSSSDSHRPAAASSPPPSFPPMALSPTVAVPKRPLSPPQPTLEIPATAAGGAVVSRPRPAVGWVWSPPPPLPASFLSSPTCSTDSVLIDFAREASAVALQPCHVDEREAEAEKVDEEITPVVRRQPASAPPAAAAATPDAWTCELWEDSALARINRRSAAGPSGGPRQSTAASSAPVAASLLTSSPAEVLLASAHREVASQLGALEVVRSTWVSLMYMAVGQAPP